MSWFFLFRYLSFFALVLVWCMAFCGVRLRLSLTYGGAGVVGRGLGSWGSLLTGSVGVSGLVPVGELLVLVGGVGQVAVYCFLGWVLLWLVGYCLVLCGVVSGSLCEVLVFRGVSRLFLFGCGWVLEVVLEASRVG